MKKKNQFQKKNTRKKMSSEEEISRSIEEQEVFSLFFNLCKFYLIRIYLKKVIEEDSIDSDEREEVLQSFLQNTNIK